MRKINLFLPLFLGSFFMPTTLDAAVFDLYKSDNNQKSDLLIASPGGHGSGEGGGGGMNTNEREQKNLNDAIGSYYWFVKELAEAEENKESFEEIQRISGKIDKYYEKIKKLDPKVFNEMFGEEAINYDTDNIKTLTTEFKVLLDPIIKTVFNDVQNKIEQTEEILIENKTAPIYLRPFFRCGILTEKALEADENDNSKKAITYAKLAIDSVMREKKILEKQEIQIKEKSIDQKLLKNIEYSLLAINSIILEDYKSGYRNIKKALESGSQDTSNLKSLVAYTGIMNGEIDQGCSDLKELIIDGTIDLVDLDIIPIEDICRFPY